MRKIILILAAMVLSTSALAADNSIISNPNSYPIMTRPTPSPLIDDYISYFRIRSWAEYWKSVEEKGKVDSFFSYYTLPRTGCSKLYSDHLCFGQTGYVEKDGTYVILHQYYDPNNKQVDKGAQHLKHEVCRLKAPQLDQGKLTVMPQVCVDFDTGEVNIYAAAATKS